jgi:(p)ppGpp synthase/HD superfamily hydrolase
LNQGNSDASKLAEAASYAITAHHGQVRKGTSIPYTSHLFAVAAIVMENGGDEELACAALLHDVIEDCGAEHETEIRARFGARVAHIVRACSDTDVQPKPPWLARKQAYLDHLETADQDTLTVSCADKLHNARAIVADLRRHGPGMLSRFNAPAGGTEWYYAALADAFSRRLPGPMSSELTIVVGELEDRIRDGEK